jgi:dienelactone hydrolase
LEYKERMRSPDLVRVLVLCFAALGGAHARAQDDSWLAALGNARETVVELREEIVNLPLRGANVEEKKFPLTATLFQPAGPGPFPVVILNHGSPARARDRDLMGRYRVIAPVRELVRMGFAVIVPMRRGYGASPGTYSEGYGSCAEAPRFEHSGFESARDVLSAIDYVRGRTSIDHNRIVLMGQSAGGFASLAAAAQSPQGVVAVVNIAGGRGGNGKDGVPCAPEAMATVIAHYASTTQAPVLWLYTENDKYFGPAASRAWFTAFQQAGGKGRYVLTAAHGDDGHLLFYAPEGAAVWSPVVQDFFKELGL